VADTGARGRGAGVKGLRRTRNADAKARDWVDPERVGSKSDGLVAGWAKLGSPWGQGLGWVYLSRIPLTRYVAFEATPKLEISSVPAGTTSVSKKHEEARFAMLEVGRGEYEMLSQKGALGPNARHDDADAVRVLLESAKALVPGGEAVLLAFIVTEPSKGRVGVDNGLVEFAALGHDLAVPELDQLGFHGALLEPVDGARLGSWSTGVRPSGRGRREQGVG